MIRGYFGLPGSGKSYGLVEDAYCEFYQKGIPVLTISQCPVSFADIVDIGDLSKIVFDIGDGLCVILDEAGLIVFSRHYLKNDPSLLELFVTHRKRGIHLLYSAQYVDQVDKVLREVTHEHVYCFNIGRFFMRFYTSKATSLMGMKVALGFFRKEVFEMYDTYAFVNRRLRQISRSTELFIREMMLYVKSRSRQNVPLLSAMKEFILFKAKRGDQDGDLIYRLFADVFDSIGVDTGVANVRVGLSDVTQGVISRD